LASWSPPTDENNASSNNVSIQACLLFLAANARAGAVA